MVRPRDLTRALAATEPELESEYRLAQKAPTLPTVSGAAYAGQVLEALVGRFRERAGGQEKPRFLVDSSWLQTRVSGMNTTQVQRAGSFDPLATYQLLQATTPYVPITDERGELLKVIDRVGVAVEIARTSVERQLGRR